MRGIKMDKSYSYNINGRFVTKEEFMAETKPKVMDLTELKLVYKPRCKTFYIYNGNKLLFESMLWSEITEKFYELIIKVNASNDLDKQQPVNINLT
jgi:hypothetical protein